MEAIGTKHVTLLLQRKLNIRFACGRALKTIAKQARASLVSSLSTCVDDYLLFTHPLYNTHARHISRIKIRKRMVNNFHCIEVIEYDVG